MKLNFCKPSNTCYWNWKWRVKSQGKDGYLMRFPNRAKLMELSNFQDFTLLGTGVVVNVQPWTFDSLADGKLHTVWLRFGKVPENYRHFFGMCEIAAAVGPVLEVDMDTITAEFVRAKVGVR